LPNVPLGLTDTAAVGNWPVGAVKTVCVVGGGGRGVEGATAALTGVVRIDFTVIEDKQKSVGGHVKLKVISS
jgi:hypothetical protein